MSEYHKLRTTRYDLDALDFNTGTATFEDWEVGQYIRLLNHAWLDGHDCTLSPDPEDLKIIARSSRDISPKVLKKFTLNEQGLYINERLLIEWNNALSRSKAGRDKANKRHHPDAAAMPKQSRGNAKALPVSVSVSVPVSDSKGVGVDEHSKLIEVEEV
jgi:hypothetical protein